MKLRNPIVGAAVSIVIAVAGTANAQSYDVWFMMTYDPSMAVGDTKDFVSNLGYFGFGVEGKTFRNANLAWGFVAEWHNMYEKTSETAQVDNVTITGTQRRFLDSIPLLLGAYYHLGSRKNRIRPYGAIKAGPYWIYQRLEVGTVKINITRGWHLGVAPEVGITFLTPDLDLYGLVSADFNYVFSREDSIDFTYLSLSIGIVYLL
jgi:hypothetical protein